ncbi:hypothetical protein HY745_12815 [Candidatus Desantisbacteria bacterium]|nr:hypothetical protein [Candidatus Desantisbacteria bacterium]
MENKKEDTSAIFFQKDDKLLYITGIIGVAISFADFIGILDNFLWIKNRIPQLILLLLATTVLYLSKALKRIENKIEITALYNLTKPDVIVFKGLTEAYNYISNKIINAKKSIDDITWAAYTGHRTKEEQEAYNNYVKTIERVCKKGTISYREIASLADKHYFTRSFNLLEHYSYHLAYHNLSSLTVPLISYIIIDNEEVIIGFYKVPGQKEPLEGIKYMNICNPVLVKFFKDYYDCIWNDAEKLKESTDINMQKINEIKVKLGA